MKKTLIKVMSVALAAGMVLGVTGCKSNKTVYDNETDSLTLATTEPDGVFNPFFSTSGVDSSVISMTQIGMISADGEGKPTYGENEPVAVLDFEKTDNGGTQYVDLQTTYYFVLKNNVRFSNGSYMTIKDVLFNLYVYLDPVYTGSSTIYSTDIVGLDEYRYQTADENEQLSVMEGFQTTASTRVNNLYGAIEAILDDNKDYFDGEMDAEAARTAMVNYLKEYNDENLLKDYNTAVELFGKELDTDWTNSLNAYEDQTFKDDKNEEHKGLFKSDLEMFLYNEGYIKWDSKNAKLEYSLGEDTTKQHINDADKGKAWAIGSVKDEYVPFKMLEVITARGTANDLFTNLTNQAMTDYYSTHTMEYKNISGIKFANKDQSVTVNGKTYNKPEYNDNADTTKGVKEGFNEVLSITINNVDPKAIWNFSFGIAPMYYYSNAEEIAKFNYEEHFGVKFSDLSFMDNTVKNPDKIGLPVGAGPYAASSRSGGINDSNRSDFYNNGYIYYERNPYYIGGPAKIKKLVYRVVASNGMLNSLYANEVDWSEPNAKLEVIEDLATKKDEGIESQSVKTLGYGYIGVNASKVPSIYVRRAIMHCIDVSLCIGYYKTGVQYIYRPMSTDNWAYPEGATAYYPYIKGEIPELDKTKVYPDYVDWVTSKGYTQGQTLSEDHQKEYIHYLVKDLAGYTLNSKNVYSKNSDTLSFRMTIAGAETDHPAYNAMNNAREILNSCNFDLEVRTDTNALKKLATGDLAVWAAAWSSTIDPDMYQVYHKDSKATSVKNWGYPSIILNAGGKYTTELGIVDELSEIIDQARSVEDNRKLSEGGQRAAYYKQALDLVMELAVELPIYHRSDLFAYKATKLDTTTFNPNPTSMKGLISDIHKVSLIVK